MLLSVKSCEFISPNGHGMSLQTKLYTHFFELNARIYYRREWTHLKKAVLVSLGVLWGRGVVPTAQGQGGGPG
jgi:hypothetical protein